jgi:glycosyltransferase involved in cell wall biosynthesis
MVVHAPYPLAETRVEREAHAAIEAGFEVDVIALRERGEPEEERAPGGERIFRLPVDRTRGGSAMVAAREYLGFTLLAAVKLARLHRRHRYSVVQIHNPPDFLVLAALVPKALGARLVFDVHDFAPELFALRFGARRGGRAAERVLWTVERVAVWLADAVVTVHEPYRRALVARGTPPGKITVVLNSPEERLLPPPAAPAPSMDAFRIVYHGTVTEHYGLETVVEAFARVASRIPGAVAEIYGGGDALERVKSRAATLGVADRMQFSDGFLDNAEVLRRIQGADVGVVANLGIARNQAALPTKLLEYVAMGIPVVASDLDAVREHFDDSEIELFRAGDPRSLADALLTVFEDPGAAAARAGRARERYEAYRWPVYADRYVKLLRSLVGDAPD